MISIRQLTARGSVGLLLGGLAACQSGPSAAELRQLQALDATLQLCNARLARRADATVGHLERNVALNHWHSKDVEVLRAAQEMQARTRAEVQYLHRLLQLLLSGNTAESSLTDSAPVAALLDKAGPGAADTLQRRLNGYARYVHQFLPAQDTLLAADARHDPRIRESVGKDLNDWRFGELQFRDASVASALATLARQEADVIRLERQVLQELSKKVGSAYLVFDKIGLAAVPESNTVREGDTYRATMYLTTTGSEVYDIRMTANEQSIQPDYRRQGPVQLSIPAAAPAGPAAWEGIIRGHYHGRDTTFRLRVPYTIQPR